MRNVSLQTKANIVASYLNGILYKDIMRQYGVNRWNIQDALSQFDMKTNRIKSYPRLPGGKKLDLKPGVVIPYKTYERSEVREFYPKKDKKFVLPDDLDIMERMDDVEDANDLAAESREFLEIDVNNNDEVRYKRSV